MSQPAIQQVFLKRIFSLLVLAASMTAAPVLRAQIAQHTQVHDATPLKAPAGARVAIVEFADMECPMCAQDNPLLMAATAKYRIPWIRHDFPLPYHVWSFQAAVDARWFDTKSKKLGDDFRNAVFANQRSIETLGELRAFAENFAQQHGIGFPFVVDPQGKLAAEVKADYALGQRVGVEHTPTVWVVTNRTTGVPYVEVVDPEHLYAIIDQALAETANEKSAAHAAYAHRQKTSQ
ncbi:MAG: DsbA family protein [Acidobacteriaceae bacterium]